MGYEPLVAVIREEGMLPVDVRDVRRGRETGKDPESLDVCWRRRQGSSAVGSQMTPGCPGRHSILTGCSRFSDDLTAAHTLRPNKHRLPMDLHQRHLGRNQSNPRGSDTA